LVFGKIIWTFGSEQVRLTNFELTNKELRHAPDASALWRRSNLKCVFKEIVRINHKTIKRVIVYEIYVGLTVKVTESKLIIYILGRTKGFRARVLLQNILNAPVISLGGSAAS